jgi:sugar phosphate isomerase/epimerase
MPLEFTGQSTGSNDSLAALAESLDRLERAGVDVAEIMPDRYWTLTGGIVNQGRLSLLCDVLDGRELSYTMHAPFGLNWFDRRHPGLQEQLFRSCIEVAAAMGAEVLVYHSGRREADGTGALTLGALLEIERDGLRTMGDFAAERGVMIAVENMTPTSERKAGLPELVPYGADLRELARQIAAVAHPNIGMCLDFGHAHLSETSTGGNIMEAVAAAAPWVNHTHIHDNFGRPDSHPHYAAHPDLRAIGESDLHMPIGWGTIPYREIFSAVPFPRTPIALSEAAVIDECVLAGTVANLREFIALNATVEAQLEPVH